MVLTWDNVPPMTRPKLIPLRVGAWMVACALGSGCGAASSLACTPTHYDEVSCSVRGMASPWTLIISGSHVEAFGMFVSCDGTWTDKSFLCFTTAALNAPPTGCEFDITRNDDGSFDTDLRSTRHDGALSAWLVVAQAAPVARLAATRWRSGGQSPGYTFPAAAVSCLHDGGDQGRTEFPQLTAPPRATRGAAIAAALATVWVSVAIGFVAVRHWRRAAFWLLTDWVWMCLAVVGGMTGHPRLMWGGFAGFLVLGGFLPPSTPIEWSCAAPT